MRIMEQKYTDIVEKKTMTAREYFMVLRLAILHVDHKYLETSYAITQYTITPDVYECACRIAEAL